MDASNYTPDPTLWANIPDELTKLNQWVCWRCEVVDGKPKKVPLNANSGVACDYTSSSNWAAFEVAREAAITNKCGIGFVLSSDDGLACIDIDVAPGERPSNAQVAIYENFKSYAEISPSGNGLHVWVKGRVERNRKRAGVELYGAKRFITVTGAVAKDRKQSIAEHQKLLNTLWAEMGPVDAHSKSAVSEIYNAPETRSDTKLLKIALSAANKDKFKELWKGRWQARYSSQSEADFALINILAHYTDNAEQVARLFLKSELGRRAKADRDDYLRPMLIRAFDRKLPPLYEMAYIAELGVWGLPALMCLGVRAVEVLRCARQPTSGEGWLSVDVAGVFSDPSPPHEFIVSQLVPAAEVTLLAAHGGAGKSILLLQMAVNVSLGLPFLERETEQAPVLFFSGEDPGAVLRHRLERVCRAVNANPVEVAKRLTVIDASAAPVLFTSVPTGGHAALATRAEATGARLIIIDNASDAFAGDEIRRREVRAFVRSLRKLGAANQAAVVLAAHVDKQTARGKGSGQGFSGSTAWHNSARSRLTLAEDENGRLQLTHDKSNYGAKAEPISLTWRDDALLETLSEERCRELEQTHAFVLANDVVQAISTLYKRGVYVRTNGKGFAKPLRESGLFSPGVARLLKDAFVQKCIDEAATKGLIRVEEYYLSDDARAKGRKSYRWKVCADAK